jgi:hypothetical protein
LGINSGLTLHADAAEDLRKLRATNSVAAGQVAALLQQAKQDTRIIDSLLDHDFGAEHTAPYHVSKWQEFWRVGYNLWRLKIWVEPKGSLDYRIVYAYEPQTRQYHVLAIVHRRFNYEPDHVITKRILKAYKGLGLTIH